MPTDIDIAQQAHMRRIGEVAQEKLGIGDEHLEPFGYYKAKISLEYVDSLKDRPDGKLVLVTAISPTPAGEGKTTTTVGLGDALNRIGKNASICLREPIAERRLWRKTDCTEVARKMEVDILHRHNLRIAASGRT